MEFLIYAIEVRRITREQSRIVNTNRAQAPATTQLKIITSKDDCVFKCLS